MLLVLIMKEYVIMLLLNTNYITFSVQIFPNFVLLAFNLKSLVLSFNIFEMLIIFSLQMSYSHQQ